MKLVARLMSEIGPHSEVKRCKTFEPAKIFIGYPPLLRFFSTNKY